MMEELELRLRRGNKSGDGLRAQVVRTLLDSRGEDIPQIQNYVAAPSLLEAVLVRSNFSEILSQSQQVGLSLRVYRLNSGLTQQQLAEKVPCDQSLLSKYERGERKPEPSGLRSICEALGMSTREYDKLLVLSQPVRQRLGNSPRQFSEELRNLGEILKGHRRKLKISQIELAGRIAFDQSLVSKVELGKRTPSPQLLDSILNALEIPDTEKEELIRRYGYPSDDKIILTEPPKVESRTRVSPSQNHPWRKQ